MTKKEQDAPDGDREKKRQAARMLAARINQDAEENVSLWLKNVVQVGGNVPPKLKVFIINCMKRVAKSAYALGVVDTLRASHEVTVKCDNGESVAVSPADIAKELAPMIGPEAAVKGAVPKAKRGGGHGTKGDC